MISSRRTKGLYFTSIIQNRALFFHKFQSTTSWDKRTYYIEVLLLTVNIWKSYVNCRQRNEYRSNHHSNEHYLSSSENKAWKKSRPVWDFDSWPLQYRCSALPTELTSQMGGHEFKFCTGSLTSTLRQYPGCLNFSRLIGSNSAPQGQNASGLQGGGCQKLQINHCFFFHLTYLNNLTELEVNLKTNHLFNLQALH